MATIAEQIKGLREERANKFKEADGFAEKRSLTEDDQKRYDAVKKEITDINGQIARLEEKEQRELENTKTVNIVSTSNTSAANNGGAEGEKRNMMSQFSWKRALNIAAKNELMSGVEKELDREERENVIAGGNTNFQPNSLMIPAGAFRRNVQKRDMSATGGSNGSEGGVNIQTNVDNLIDVFLPNMVLGQLPVTKFNNLRGNVKFPQASTFPSANWQTENGATTEKSPAFTSLTLSPKRLTAKIQMSNQLLIQSENNIQAYANRFLVNAMAIEFEKASLVGGGSNEPTGIIGGTGWTAVYAGGALTNGTNAAGSRPVWADMVNHVANAKGVNAPDGQAYITSPKLMGRLQITPRQSAGVEGNFILRDWNSGVNGYRMLGTTNLPDTFSKGGSVVLSAMVFGDFSNLAMASWGGMELLVDPYVNAGEGLLNTYLNAYVDAGMLNPLAFTVCKDYQWY